MARIKCPACGKAVLQPIVEPKLEKLFEGVKIVVNDARLSRCPACGEETYSARELQRWRGIKERFLASRGQTPTGADIEQVRERHGLSVANFASLLGVTRQTVHAWERASDAGMKFGPAALLILLLTAEVNGNVRNVFARLLSFAKRRGQLESLPEQSPQEAPPPPLPCCLSQRRSRGTPSFSTPARATSTPVGAT